MSEKPPRPEKVKRVEELKAIMDSAEGIYFLDFTGLKVGEINELRRRLARKDIHFEVVKNSLTVLAAKQLGLEEIAKILVGPNSIVVTRGDPIEPIRIIQDFRDEFEKTDFNGGYLSGRLLGKDEIEKLGKLPSLQHLRARTVGALQAPLQHLVWTMTGLLKKLVLDLKSLQEKKEEVS